MLVGDPLRAPDTPRGAGRERRATASDAGRYPAKYGRVGAKPSGCRFPTVRLRSSLRSNLRLHAQVCVWSGPHQGSSRVVRAGHDRDHAGEQPHRGGEKFGPLGHHDRIREGRLLLQRSLEKDFRSVGEGVLGRRTLAFISGIDVDRDVAVEFFTLEP
jgi:hypothetical protein